MFFFRPPSGCLLRAVPFPVPLFAVFFLRSVSIDRQAMVMLEMAPGPATAVFLALFEPPSAGETPSAMFVKRYDPTSIQVRKATRV